MRTNIVLTLAGPDRVGIVEEVTKVILGLDGNVENSRMSRLGGEFAILMLVALPEENVGELEIALEYLKTQDYSLSVRATRQGQIGAHPGWRPYRVEVQGADHEGIVHSIAAGLARLGISIESMDSWVSRAPMSGSGLFSMMALVVVPPRIVDTEWQEAVQATAEETGVDVVISPIE